jgi:hypothetical protein
MSRANDELAHARPDDWECLLAELDALREEVKSLRALLVLQSAKLRQLRGALGGQLSESGAD